ncbi:J domain-containing protein [Desnuesiella massiliensis]|uniref:J domain-containing protein n=1 Tax=Desnuesiella massiliensis TaxID=1650662 RepID=UPI0006E31892|nr:J domain-containing protein [Desnuesiella massiliensis]
MGKFDINLEQAMELLNLKPGFTENEFKINYRNLMKNIHPDTLGDINEAARKIIEDEVKRVNIAKGIIESFLMKQSSDINNEDKQKREREQQDRQRREKERQEHQRREREQQEQQRREKERQEQQRREREQQEQQRREKERQEQQRREREQQEQQRRDREQQEQQRREKEQEQRRKEKERQKQEREEDILKWKKYAKEKEREAKQEVKQELREKYRQNNRMFNFIPGFGTGAKWKMVVAIIYYSLCLFMATGGIYLFLFFISIPFFVYNLIKSIKIKTTKFIIITIIAFVTFCISIYMTPETKNAVETKTTVDSNGNKSQEANTNTSRDNSVKTSISDTSEKSKNENRDQEKPQINSQLSSTNIESSEKKSNQQISTNQVPVKQEDTKTYSNDVTKAVSALGIDYRSLLHGGLTDGMSFDIRYEPTSGYSKASNGHEFTWWFDQHKDSINQVTLRLPEVEDRELALQYVLNGIKDHYKYTSVEKDGDFKAWIQGHGFIIKVEINQSKGYDIIVMSQ